MIKVYGYKKCSTVKKALKFLEDNNIEYTHIDNVEDRLTSEQLKSLHERSGLEIKRFFNTSGIMYRERGLKDVVPTISNQEAYELLSTEGMLVKRPIFDNGVDVLVGFKLPEWEAVINN